MVTLRGNRMWDFYDRLVNIALPRTRDFRGVPNNSFDGHGNYSLGIREHTIFPDIDIQGLDRVRGFQVNIISTMFFMVSLNCNFRFVVDCPFISLMGLGANNIVFSRLCLCCNLEEK